MARLPADPARRRALARLGVAALALSAHPGMNPGQLASFLERTATPLACPVGVYEPRPGFPATCTGGARNSFYGAGNVNALNVVQ